MKKTQLIVSRKKMFIGRLVCPVYAITKYIDGYLLDIYDLVYIKKINKFIIRESTLDDKVRRELLDNNRWCRTKRELHELTDLYCSFGLINVTKIKKVFKIECYDRDELYYSLYRKEFIHEKISKEEKKKLDESCEEIISKLQQISKEFIEYF